MPTDYILALLMAERDAERMRQRWAAKRKAEKKGRRKLKGGAGRSIHLPAPARIKTDADFSSVRN
jgi:hypothetical protein